MSSEQQWEQDKNFPNAIHTSFGGGYTFFLHEPYHVREFLRVNEKIQRARLTDVQQDAGGRWHWAEQLVDSYPCHCTDNRHGTQHSIGADELNALESRLSEEQQARQRAEEERRDAIQSMQVAEAYGIKQARRAEAAEAENTRLQHEVDVLRATVEGDNETVISLRAQVEGLEAKAALADDTALVFRSTKPKDTLWALDIPGWLARYDALTATQEPTAPTQEGE